MTPEQTARDMLERMGVEDAQRFTSGDVIELANLIDGHAKLRAFAADVVGAITVASTPSFLWRRMHEIAETHTAIDAIVSRRAPLARTEQ